MHWGSCGGGVPVLSLLRQLLQWGVIADRLETALQCGVCTPRAYPCRLLLVREDVGQHSGLLGRVKGITEAPVTVHQEPMCEFRDSGDLAEGLAAQAACTLPCAFEKFQIALKMLQHF